MTSNIFAQTAEGQVTHTSISRLLATNDGFAGLVSLHLDEWGPSSLKLPEALTKYGDSQEPGHTCYSLEFGEGKTFFEIAGRPENDERTKRFAAAMQFLTSDYSWSVQHVFDAFDWAAHDKAGTMVVDLGGGRGHISQFIADRTQNMHFIVQDVPHVIEALPPSLTQSKRLSFRVQNFLEPQQHLPSTPDGKADIVFLRWIMHDWGDKYCVQILQNLIPILRPGTRVLIYDSILKEGAVEEAEKMGVMLDLLMMVLFNGKERTENDFKELVRRAGERFRFVEVRQPTASRLGCVEIVWEG
jgi:O-methyltransferase domain